jgi:SpoVK/Ycf46/Vps4 family AAA+-type ATPase
MEQKFIKQKLKTTTKKQHKFKQRGGAPAEISAAECDTLNAEGSLNLNLCDGIKESQVLYNNAKFYYSAGQFQGALVSYACAAVSFNWIIKGLRNVPDPNKYGSLITKAENIQNCCLISVEQLQNKLKSMNLSNPKDNEDQEEWEKRCTKIKPLIYSKGSKDCIFYDNVIGLHAEKQKINDSFIYPLMYPNLYPSVSKGILLYGPPGTGKTLIVKAAVNELQDKDPDIGVLYFAPSPADLKGKYVGETEKKIEEWFTCASAAACKCQENSTDKKYIAIIFIDEIDSIAGSRDNDPTGLNANSVNTLLQMMDGINSKPNVSIIGATNYPWKLDSAVIRRFDTQILINVPSELELKEILSYEMNRMVEMKDRVAKFCEETKTKADDSDDEDKKECETQQCVRQAKSQLFESMEPYNQFTIEYFEDLNNSSKTSSLSMASGLIHRLHEENYTNSDISRLVKSASTYAGQLAVKANLFYNIKMFLPQDTGANRYISSITQFKNKKMLLTKSVEILNEIQRKQDTTAKIYQAEPPTISSVDFAGYTYYHVKCLLYKNNTDFFIEHPLVKNVFVKGNEIGKTMDEDAYRNNILGEAMNGDIDIIITFKFDFIQDHSTGNILNYLIEPPVLCPNFFEPFRDILVGTYAKPPILGGGVDDELVQTGGLKKTEIANLLNTYFGIKNITDNDIKDNNTINVNSYPVNIGTDFTNKTGTNYTNYLTKNYNKDGTSKSPTTPSSPTTPTSSTTPTTPGQMSIGSLTDPKILFEPNKDKNSVKLSQEYKDVIKNASQYLGFNGDINANIITKYNDINIQKHDYSFLSYLHYRNNPNDKDYSLLNFSKYFIYFNNADLLQINWTNNFDSEISDTTFNDNYTTFYNDKLDVYFYVSETAVTFKNIALKTMITNFATIDAAVNDFTSGYKYTLGGGVFQRGGAPGTSNQDIYNKHPDCEILLSETKNPGGITIDGQEYKHNYTYVVSRMKRYIDYIILPTKSSPKSDAQFYFIGNPNGYDKNGKIVAPSVSPSATTAAAATAVDAQALKVKVDAGEIYVSCSHDVFKILFGRNILGIKQLPSTTDFKLNDSAPNILDTDTILFEPKFTQLIFDDMFSFYKMYKNVYDNNINFSAKKSEYVDPETILYENLLQIKPIMIETIDIVSVGDNIKTIYEEEEDLLSGISGGGKVTGNNLKIIKDNNKTDPAFVFTANLFSKYHTESFGTVTPVITTQGDAKQKFEQIINTINKSQLADYKKQGFDDPLNVDDAYLTDYIKMSQTNSKPTYKEFITANVLPIGAQTEFKTIYEYVTNIFSGDFKDMLNPTELLYRCAFGVIVQFYQILKGLPKQRENLIKSFNNEAASNAAATIKPFYDYCVDNSSINTQGVSNVVNKEIFLATTYNFETIKKLQKDSLLITTHNAITYLWNTAASLVKQTGYDAATQAKVDSQENLQKMVADNKLLATIFRKVDGVGFMIEDDTPVAAATATGAKQPVKNKTISDDNFNTRGDNCEILPIAKVKINWMTIGKGGWYKMLTDWVKWVISTIPLIETATAAILTALMSSVNTGMVWVGGAVSGVVLGCASWWITAPLLLYYIFSAIQTYWTKDNPNIDYIIDNVIIVQIYKIITEMGGIRTPNFIKDPATIFQEELNKLLDAATTWFTWFNNLSSKDRNIVVSDTRNTTTNLDIQLYCVPKNANKQIKTQLYNLSIPLSCLYKAKFDVGSTYDKALGGELIEYKQDKNKLLEKKKKEKAKNT